MKRKVVPREHVRDLHIKPKKIDVDEIMRLVKKIGNPFDEEDPRYGKYKYS